MIRCRMGLRKTSTTLRIGHAFSLRGMLMMITVRSNLRA